MARQPDRFLEIYLADHLAAAAAGLALVRRAARSNTGTRTGDTLRRLTVEIDEDRHALRRLVTDLGFTGSKPKEVVAWAAEKVGRLKRNGQLRGYSPLSRVLLPAMPTDSASSSRTAVELSAVLASRFKRGGASGRNGQAQPLNAVLILRQSPTPAGSRSPRGGATGVTGRRA